VDNPNYPEFVLGKSKMDVVIIQTTMKMCVGDIHICFSNKKPNALNFETNVNMVMDICIRI
jgi:hypothetical protein